MKIKLSGLLLGLLLASTLTFAAQGSCGAGKCGAEMKKDMKYEMKDTKKEMKDEMKGSCGTGKCGSK